MSKKAEGVPRLTLDALDRYVNHRMMPGGFLYNVLCNDLFGAVGYADADNRKGLSSLVTYIYNNVTSECWGSRERVNAYLAGRAL